MKKALLTIIAFGLAGLSLGAAEDSGKRKLILFLGDSLTAGYGLDPAMAFPALIQKRIDEKNWPFEAFNAGLSGETSSGGLRRIEWLMRREPHVLVLELGANDGLRGVPLDLTKRNLQAIIDRAKSRFPNLKVVLAGMMVPPNLGEQYTSRFEAIFRELAQENQAELIPFLLEGVAGDPKLNLPDGIHPTAAGHEIISRNVWAVLEPILKQALDAD